jgi:hypothetical protein
MSLFNAVSLMATNPQAQSAIPANYELPVWA